MPHDKNGEPLKVGDVVNIEYKVVQVWPGETMCNVQLEATEKVDGEYAPQQSCNAKFVRANVDREG